MAAAKKPRKRLFFLSHKDFWLYEVNETRHKLRKLHNYKVQRNPLSSERRKFEPNSLDFSKTINTTLSAFNYAKVFKL